MMNESQPNRLFTLNVAFRDPLQNRLFSLVKGPIEHFLAFPRMNRAYTDISEMSDNRPFPDKVLDKLNVTYDLTAEDIYRLMIPTGPVIVVANHPFGGIEGIILASLLRSLRCDVKFMANYLLNSIPEMREMLITVNPFKGETTVKNNIKPVRESIQWVRNGGMLVVFPAGAVSHFDARKGVITDPPWSPSIARIIRKTGAPVLPVFFQGTNSAAFHMVGMVHPVLRTAMLPNELFNKNRRNIQVLVGDLLPTVKLKVFDQDDDMTAYLRLRTYILEHRGGKVEVPSIAAFIRKAKHETYGSILPQQNQATMAEEIRRLPLSQMLVESNDHAVYQATTDQIPHILLEIGRLREITFRAVGEGTGKSVDIDRFDHSYTHLFIWNRRKKEIVGAYRLGKTDEIIRQKGVRALYTSTLFNYKRGFFEHLGPALEMGRSFVRIEYQKSFAPLLLLWKGIGRFVVENPQYKILFGPVSISDEYQALSRQFLVSYLKMTRFRNDMAGFVKPKKPFPKKSLKGWDIDAAVQILKDDMENISELISCVESDNKGIPILLKQYLKLGGEIAGFNVDTAFGKVVDGLIVIDLTKAEPRMLDRYLGKDGASMFLAHHEALNRDRTVACA